MLAYIILCTLPCFAVILAGSKVLPGRAITPVTLKHLLLFASAALRAAGSLSSHLQC